MNINLHNLKQELDRYYQGQSTVEEENALRYFFNNEYIPAEFEADREIFRFSSGYAIDVNQDELNTTLWKALHDGAEMKAKKRSLIIRRISWLSIAASVLIIIGLNFIFTQKNEPVLMADTFDDPAVALQQTREILQRISANMNKGFSELESLSSMNDALGKLAPLGEMPKQFDMISPIGVMDHPFILNNATNN